MALSGGKGYGPQGARDKPTGNNKPGGGPGGNPNDKFGPSKPSAAAPAEKSLPERIGDFFGGPEAYARNKARRQGGITVPNVPNASVGQMFGAFLGGFPGITSGPMVVKEMYDSFQPDFTPGLGIGQGLVDGLLGGTPGKIDGTAQAGRWNDQGDPGKGRGLLDYPSQMQTPAQMPATQEVQQQTLDPRKRAYALGLNGIPSPMGYQYQTAKWL